MHKLRMIIAEVRRYEYKCSHLMSDHHQRKTIEMTPICSIFHTKYVYMLKLALGKSTRVENIISRLTRNDVHSLIKPRQNAFQSLSANIIVSYTQNPRVSPQN